MNLKFLLATLFGGIVFFLMGWVVYGFLLMNFMESTGNMACMRAEEDMILPLLFLANLLYAFLYAFFLTKCGEPINMMTGAKYGFILTALIVAIHGCAYYATSTMMNTFSAVIVDVIGSGVIGAVSGGVVGWWLGRK